MRGRVMKVGLGIKRPMRVYIQLRNKSVYYRDLRTERMANELLEKVSCNTKTLPLKQWHKAA